MFDATFRIMGIRIFLSFVVAALPVQSRAQDEEMTIEEINELLMIISEDAIRPARLSFTSDIGLIADATWGDPEVFGPLFGELTGVFSPALRFGGYDGFVLEAGYAASTVYDENSGWSDITWSRDFARLVYDLPESAVRLQLGDVFVDAEGFQGSEQILGVAIATDYPNLQPLRITRVAGERVVTLPRRSTVQVFVNGVLVSSRSVPPGQYTATELGAPETGRVEIVARGDDGSVRRFDFARTPRSVLLAPGVREFGVFLGVEAERGPAGPEYDFGRPVASGFYRQSLAGQADLGFTAQLNDDAVQFGAEIVAPAVGGIFSATSAWSDSPLGAGTALRLQQDWSRLPRNGFISLSGTLLSENFVAPTSFEVASISDDPESGAPAQPAVFEGFLSAGLDLSPVITLDLNADARFLRDDPLNGLGEGWEYSAGATLSWSLSEESVLNASLIQSEFEGASETSVQITFQTPLGQRGQRVTQTYDSTDDRFATLLSRDAEGFVDDASYLVGVESSTSGQREDILLADASVLTNRGTANFSLRNRIDGRATSEPNSLFFEFNTAIGIADGAIGWGQSGFGTSPFVVVNGAPDDRDLFLQGVIDDDERGVSGYSARTGPLGNPMVADLLPYTEESLTLTELDSASGNVVREGFVSIAGAYRSVTVLDYPMIDPEFFFEFDDPTSSSGD